MPGGMWACDRVQRICRREGLKVPQKQRPRGRLWLNDGSCFRLRPERRNHVWTYDFVETQTHDGCKLRLMTLIDEYTRECLAIRVARRINSFGVLESMADVMLMRGVPEHIRSDNGAEMTAKVVRNWLTQVGSKTLFIKPGSPGRTATASPSTGRYAMSC
jgi:putative transposase